MDDRARICPSSPKHKTKPPREPFERARAIERTRAHAFVQSRARAFAFVRSRAFAFAFVQSRARAFKMIQSSRERDATSTTASTASIDRSIDMRAGVCATRARGASSGRARATTTGTTGNARRVGASTWRPSSSSSSSRTRARGGRARRRAMEDGFPSDADVRARRRRGGGGRERGGWAR